MVPRPSSDAALATRGVAGCMRDRDAAHRNIIASTHEAVIWLSVKNALVYRKHHEQKRLRLVLINMINDARPRRVFELALLL